MHANSRPEFEAAVAKLCAAYNVPSTPERIDAYWTSFRLLGLHEFVRVVENALGKDATQRFPTIGQLWGMRKNLRTTAPAAPLKEEPDFLEYFANRLLMQHIMGRRTLGSIGRFKPGYGMVDCHASAELNACLAMKRALVNEFTAYIREGDELATPIEFVRRWVADLKRIGEVTEITLAQYRALCAEAPARKPFPIAMAGYERAA